MTNNHFDITITLDTILDPSTLNWLSDLAVEVDNKKTRLMGELPDQSSIFGILNRIRDLGLQINLIEIYRK
jgi:hypothetical protein